MRERNDIFTLWHDVARLATCSCCKLATFAALLLALCAPLFPLRLEQVDYQLPATPATDRYLACRTMESWLVEVPMLETLLASIKVWDPDKKKLKRGSSETTKKIKKMPNLGFLWIFLTQYLGLRWKLFGPWISWNFWQAFLQGGTWFRFETEACVWTVQPRHVL